MGLASSNCPNCGVRFNARETSIGTMRRCQACGHKFLLVEAPSPPGPGCAQIATGFAVLMGIGLVCVFGCCGGIAYLGNAGPHEVANKPNASTHAKKASVKPGRREHASSKPVELANAEKPSDEELYRIIDAKYGYPIKNLKSFDFIKDLREFGFEGPEADNDALFDTPEKRLLSSYCLKRTRDNVELWVEVLADLKDQVRNIDFSFLSLDGTPASSKAATLLPPALATLRRPKVTKWLLDHSGKRASIDLEGTSMESTGTSDFPQIWKCIIKGSLSTADAHHGLEVPAPTDYHVPREWQDATGSFKVVASFVSLGNGKVKLKKENGAVIEVAIEVLSANDRAFVRGLLRN